MRTPPLRAADWQREPAAAEEPAPVGVPATKLEEYLFDLNGFVVLKGALSLAEVDELNAALDALPKMKLGDWFGHAHMTSGPGDVSLQQVYELGDPFERLIDHPAYFEKLKRFIGGDGWDNNHAPLMIDEAFANFRATGGSIPMHGSATATGSSSGAPGRKGSYWYSHAGEEGTFNSGQINMALCLAPIRPGDGATMLVPGSHKANIAIRDVPELRPTDSGSMDGVLGAVPQYMEPGDVLLFVDCVTHGGERKTTHGVRRTIWYRYTMAWSRLRYGYQPSRELCERLTPQRAAIVDPHYARMLERYPQVEPSFSKFEEGEAWSVEFLSKDIRDQQVQAHQEPLAKARIPLEEKERAGTLTEEEAKRLANIRDREKGFDPTSH